MRYLNIYFTSDVHGFVYPTDYMDDTIKQMGLLAISEAIDKDGNTLVIDGGDTIQGSPFASFVEEKRFAENPFSDLMNEVGYDYVTLGNHDFNYGYDYLMNYLSRLSAKVLCANVKDISLDAPALIQKTALQTMANGLVVGLVGLTTDYINVWEKEEHLTKLSITDPFAEAVKAIEILKSKCDILIGIYHGGFENDIETHQLLSDSKENIAFQLSKELNFDILLTGHQHMEVINKTLFGTHIVQTPANGQKFARVTIQVDTAGTKQITSELLIPTANVASALYKKFANLQGDVQLWLDQKIGHIDTPLMPSSHLDMAINGSALANFLNQVQLEASGADISCTSLANQVKGLPEEVTIRDVVTTYIYPNTMMVLEVNRAVLKAALERCAAYFALTADGVTIADAFLKPKEEHYNYDYFSGIDYTYDLTKPVGARVKSIVYQGQELPENQKLSLVMNNYRATGTGGYDCFKTCPILKDIQISTSDIVIDYIKNHPVVTVDNKSYYKVITKTD